jgi:hypothetical protein
LLKTDPGGQYEYTLQLLLHDGDTNPVLPP